MASVIIPCSLDRIRRVKSKKIVDDFRDTDLPRAEVDVSKTGRDFQQVYSALFMYVKKHPELEVELVREDGNIVLYRSVIGTDSTICDKGVDDR